MTPFATYVLQLDAALSRGDSTEHTHRPALKTLIESLAPGIVATNEPRRIECGSPDFIVTRNQTPLGYVEAKDIGRPLTDAEKSDQMKRYFNGLSNLILTDYIEFRWYVDGDCRMTARVARQTENCGLSLAPGGAVSEVEQLFALFLNQDSPIAASARDLASRMAGLARIAQHAIREAFAREAPGGSGVLHQQIDGFRNVLLHDMSEGEFADMYAQTIAYGLFAARCNTRPGEPFDRRQAAWLLPRTNPFLRSVFNNIAGPDAEDHLDWVIDSLSRLLDQADMPRILADFGKRTRQEDPVIHFYETFLREYDPKMRELRGVYYTPEPVVSYIVRSVDIILRRDFGFEHGLADESKVKSATPALASVSNAPSGAHQVQILDPATGTGTFLQSIIDTIAERFVNNKGAWSGYVAEHLLPRLFGFELLMAPYAVAHLKLALQLKQSGYDIERDERLGVYMTNTLEEAARAGQSLFAQAVADEANAAYSVKKDSPVMVVLGNPPYSGHSANKGAWINGLLHGRDSITQITTASYFEVDGRPLNERNPKWLNDDYVKFIRFAQWRIERTGCGILAFITNNGYLDNPTFRGMRHSLMRTFDDIYILDLHGNSKKRETAPDGGKDENVFDIRQGVAIGIFVKRRGSEASDSPARVHHSDMYGARTVKYGLLRDSDIAATAWARASSVGPNWWFVPREDALADEYNKGWDLTKVFPNHGPGMTTARDAFVTDFDPASLEQRITAFRDSSASDSDLCSDFGISEKLGWNVSRARQMLLDEPHLGSHITSIIYRPFDRRVIYYHDAVVWRTVKAVMHNMIRRENLGLIATRQTRDAWDAFATKLPITHKAMAAYDINMLFPLYLYPNGVSTSGLFDDVDISSTPGGRRPNLASDFVAAFSASLKLTFVQDGRGDLQTTFGPEDVFDYLYAVFHCPSFRARYAGALKRDFPRIPLTATASLFRSLCSAGRKLVKLHTMEARGEHPANYPIPLPRSDPSSDVVRLVRYAEPTGSAPGRVYINHSQYFEGVAPEVWSFHVGGYQVCEKWLKDRKGRKLKFDDIEHYRYIVAAFRDTMALVREIDGVVDRHGGWPLG